MRGGTCFGAQPRHLGAARPGGPLPETAGQNNKTVNQETVKQIRNNKAGQKQ